MTYQPHQSEDTTLKTAMTSGRYKVRIRRDLAKVKPEAEQVDGNVYEFEYGWTITADDSSIYVGEFAMVPLGPDYPADAPAWIASGDLEAVA